MCISFKGIVLLQNNIFIFCRERNPWWNVLDQNQQRCNTVWKKVADTSFESFNLATWSEMADTSLTLQFCNRVWNGCHLYKSLTPCLCLHCSAVAWVVLVQVASQGYSPLDSWFLGLYRQFDNWVRSETCPENVIHILFGSQWPTFGFLGPFLAYFSKILTQFCPFYNVFVLNVFFTLAFNLALPGKLLAHFLCFFFVNIFSRFFE